MHPASIKQKLTDSISKNSQNLNCTLFIKFVCYEQTWTIFILIIILKRKINNQKLALLSIDTLIKQKKIQISTDYPICNKPVHLNS